LWRAPRDPDNPAADTIPSASPKQETTMLMNPIPALLILATMFGLAATILLAEQATGSLALPPVLGWTAPLLVEVAALACLGLALFVRTKTRSRRGGRS